MRHIIKSYLKSYFKNWVEAIGLIIFITIAVTILVGSISSSVQYLGIYSSTQKNSGVFDGYLNFEYDSRNEKTNIKEGVFEDYYVNNIDWNNEVVLDEEYSIIDKTWFDNNIKNVGSSDDESTEAARITSDIAEKSLYPLFVLQPTTWSEAAIQSKYGITEQGFALLQANKFDFKFELASRLFKDKNVDVGYNQAFYSQVISEEGDEQGLKQFYVTTVDNINVNEPTESVNYNKLVTYDGEHQKDDQTVVLGSKGSEYFGLDIGSQFKFNNNKDYPEYKVTGIGSTVNTIVKRSKRETPPSQESGSFFQSQSSNKENYLQVYVNGTQFETIKSELKNVGGYAIADLNEIILKTSISDQELFDILGNLFVQDGTTGVKFWENSQVYSLTNTTNITLYINIGIGAILLILGFVFINFSMKKEINKTKKQIGIFKSFGYTTRELSWIFATKFLLTMLVGIIAGFILSIPLQFISADTFVNSLEIPFQVIYSGAGYLLILFVVVPGVFTLISYALTLQNIKMPVLELLAGSIKSKVTWLSRTATWAFQKTHFILRVQVAFTFKAFGKWVAVMVIFFISSLLLLMTLDISTVLNSTTDNMFKSYSENVTYYTDPAQALETKPDLTSNNQLMFKNDLETDYEEFSVNPEEFGEIDFIKAETSTFAAIALEVKTEYEAQKKANSYNVQTLLDVLDQEDAAIYGKTANAEDVRQVLDSIFRANLLSGENSVQLPMWAIMNISALKALGDLGTAHVSFNKYYYNNEYTIPTLSVKLSVPTGPLSRVSDLKLSSIDKETYKDFYNLTTSDEGMDEVFTTVDYKTDAVPVIIPQVVAVAENLAIGDEYKFQIDGINQTYKPTFKVSGIIKDDVGGSSIFINYDNLKQFYVDKNGDDILENLYTGIISKESIIDGQLNLQNIMDIKFLMPRSTIAFSNLDTLGNISDKTSLTMSQLLGQRPINVDGEDKVYDSNKYSHSIYAPNTATPLEIIRQAAAQGTELSNTIFTVMQVLIAFIIFIILVVIVSTIIDEALQVLLTMRALGYKPGQINFIVIGNYILGIILFFIVAYIVSIFAWSVIIDLIFNTFGFLLAAPSNAVTPLTAAAIVVVVLSAAWWISMQFVKRRRLTELMEG